jgi:hypothetical protein
VEGKTGCSGATQDGKTHYDSMFGFKMQIVKLGFSTFGARCRSVFKTREFRFDYLTNMIDGIK